MDGVIPAGVWVDDSEDYDPVLRRADGSSVDTWCEDYPYADRLDRDSYEHAKRLLQVELLKLQYWVKDTGCRIVVLFEGRDVAGKGGTIKRFTEHLDPPGGHGWWRWKSPPRRNAVSGTSSGTVRPCNRQSHPGLTIPREISGRARHP